jgi:hypothetical protein
LTIDAQNPAPKEPLGALPRWTVSVGTPSRVFGSFRVL